MKMVRYIAERHVRVSRRTDPNQTGLSRGWMRCVVSLTVLLTSTSHAADWTTLAGHSARNSATAGAPAALSFELWRTDTDLAGESLVFEGPASPVVFDGRVYANARQFNESGAYVANRIVAMDLESGAIAFETVVAKGVLDSWSSPSVDPAHRLVLLASGASLFGVDADSGVVAFETPLDRSVVNASVVVAEDPPFGRAFITDYTGFGGGATLYCVNTAAYDESENPFDVGEIVWREAIGGASGATPSYRNGVVYVACTAEPTTPSGQQAGHAGAYDIDGPEGQRLLWRATLASAGVSGQGFFGGVAVAGDAIYAASYNTSGAGDNSTLVKIDATSGQIDWTTSCERTNSIPVVVGERI
ncbi:MAG: PQQ-binding-like beta-propeller repeat protein [Phycisphaerales bacterium]|nr:PQQ-binding-like beta-propeller repeat protein [Phycisphaerales bacterium]